MLWTVRGTLQRTQQDVTIVVEAESRDEAEYMGWRRGLYVAFVEEASPVEVSTARASRLLWRYTPESPFRAFGKQVPLAQVVGLLLCGIVTIVVLLQRAGVSRLLPI